MSTRLRLGAVSAGISTALVLLFVAGASARTTIKPIRVAATQQDDGSYEGTASCPAGRKVVSGGFASPGPASVVVNHAVGDDAWTIKAFDTGQISVVAYCSLYVKQLTVQTATGAMDEVNDQQGGATAQCPSNTQAASGGWEYENPTSNSPVYTSRPVGKTGWKVYGASSDTGNSITSYAYCVSGRTVTIRAGEPTSVNNQAPGPARAAQPV